MATTTSMTGKTVLITGGTGGIGRATAIGVSAGLVGLPLDAAP
jgi:NAD(P)-dependent dehydrogenase (short-subunit alcohol dehydrogenase family)